MFDFRKIWHALFSWNTHFEIHPSALLPTIFQRWFKVEIYFPHSETAFFNMFHWVGANGFYAHWKLFIFGAELFAADKNYHWRKQKTEREKSFQRKILFLLVDDRFFGLWKPFLLHFSETPIYDSFFLSGGPIFFNKFFHSS